MTRRTTMKHNMMRLAPAGLGLLVGLAVGAALPRSGSVIEQAAASPPSGLNRDRGGLINPADQRREIVNQLESMNKRIERLTKRLADGAIEVKVVEMPDQPESD